MNRDIMLYPQIPSAMNGSSLHIRVWDLPTRLFHWLLLIAVTGALISVQFGWMTWHGRFGLTVLGLISFRIVWGVIGSTHARFWNFVTGPGRMLAYLRGDYHPIGHNPLGALSVLAILGLLLFQSVSGLFATDDIAFDGPLRRAVASSTSVWLTGWHMRMEWVIYALITLHVCAVLFHVLIRKETLIRPMITGRKPIANVPAAEARGGGWPALLIALAVTAAVVWIANGALLPEPPPPPPDLGW
jgi:cytochrome b